MTYPDVTPTKATTAATLWPVNVAEVRDHLRIDHTDEDATLQRLIRTATTHTEDYTERALLTQTWTVYYDSFPNEMELPKPPLASVTSIAYVDTDGDDQTVSTSTYTVDTSSEPGRVYLAYNQSWPTTRGVEKAVTVTYVAGWTAATSVPEPIRHAVLMQIADLYELREPTIIGTIQTALPHAARLLDPYVIRETE